MKKQWLVHMKNDKTTAHSHDKSYGIKFMVIKILI